VPLVYESVRQYKKHCRDGCKSEKENNIKKDGKQMGEQRDRTGKERGKNGGSQQTNRTISPIFCLPKHFFQSLYKRASTKRTDRWYTSHPERTPSPLRKT
jgi:hypothetical protein